MLRLIAVMAILAALIYFVMGDGGKKTSRITKISAARSWKLYASKRTTRSPASVSPWTISKKINRKNDLNLRG